MHIYIYIKKYYTVRLNGIRLYHCSASRTEKITLAILALYVCILKAVTVFKEFLQCLAEKKAYLLRPALQCAEDGET